ncbi:MAG: phospholipase D-like domain-containing protein [Promethearchaeota archaeon]
MKYLTTYKKSLFELITSYGEIIKLKIAVPFIKQPAFEKLFRSTNQKGDLIEIVTELRYYQISQNLLKSLLDKKIHVKIYEQEDKLLHGKLILIYFKRESLAICGSSNLTTGGFQNNLEFNFIISKHDDPDLFYNLEENFDSLWNGKLGKVMDLNKTIINQYKNIVSNKKPKISLPSKLDGDLIDLIEFPNQLLPIKKQNRIFVLLDEYRENKHTQEEYQYHYENYITTKRLCLNPKIGTLQKFIVEDIMDPQIYEGKAKEYYDLIIKENGKVNILKAICKLPIKDVSIYEKMLNLLKLKQVGLFIGSQIWTGLEEDGLVVYHKRLLKAINRLFNIDRFGKDIQRRELNIEERLDLYLEFNEFCKRIKNAYNFRNMAELHSFLWFGEKNNWNFKKS